MQNSFLFDLIPSGPAMLFLELSQEQTKNARPSQSGLTMFLICFGVVGVEEAWDGEACAAANDGK